MNIPKRLIKFMNSDECDRARAYKCARGVKSRERES